MIATVFLCSLSLATMPPLDPGIFDAGLIAGRGFEVALPVRDTSSPDWDSLYGSFRNRSQRIRLSVEVDRCKRPGARQRMIDNINSMMAFGTLDGWPTGGWSRLPAGDKSHSVYSRTSGSAHLYMFIGDYILGAVMSYRGSGSPGNITWSGSDKPGDRAAVEGFCRDILANAVGADLAPSANVVVNGQVITGVKRDSQGRRYVPLRDWCSARNIALFANRPHGTGSFSHGGRNFVLAVASAKIKVGSNWVDLDGFTVRADGRWYAPFDGLENAI
ncbi:MAG: hypothetical protein ACR2HJ_08315 [Fimbriimonadales bacterium]